MGTINYKTSKYITLAVKPYDIDDFLRDPDFIYNLQENGHDVDLDTAIYDDIARDIAADEIQEYYSCDAENARAIIEKYNMEWFTLSIEYGYYEGLSIDINNNLPVFFDDMAERKTALTELSILKAALVDLAGVGFVECCPWWCTTYGDYKSTLKAINKAIKAARDEIQHTPTYRTYKRKTA